MARKELPQMTPWVIVSPDGWEWLGYMEDEAHAWDIALGWPSPEEIAEHKANGWYAAEATVTWKRPGHSPDAGRASPTCKESLPVDADGVPDTSGGEDNG